MSNIVVECKNKSALALQPNEPHGQYTTTIQEKITLEDGDSIIMKSAFIDTQASSNQKIIIPKDLTLTMEFVPYLMNQFNADYQTSNTLSGSNINDGLPYLLCNEVDTTAGNIRTLKPLDDFDNSGTIFRCSNTSGGEVSWGGFIATLHYVDPEGQSRTQTRQIPSFKFNAKDPAEYTVHFPAIFDSTGLTKITAPNGTVLAPQNASGGANTFNNTEIDFLGLTSGWPNSDEFSSPITADKTFEAQQFRREIKIKKGNYDPEDLCDAFNREAEKVTDVGLEYPNNLTNNTFLQQIKIPIASPADDKKHFFVNPTKSKDLNMDTNAEFDYRFRYATQPAAPLPDLNALIVGASQVTLSWEESTQTFEFEYLHMPFYSGQNEAVGYFNGKKFSNATDPANYESVLRTVNRNAGVLLTELQAVDSDGATSHFWDRILGFDIRPKVDGKVNTDSILFQYANDLNYDISTGARPIVFKPSAIFNPTIGKQFTAGYQGIDTVVTKKDISVTEAGFPFVNNFGSGGNNAGYDLSTLEKTTPISAGDNILTAADSSNFGYYLVEVISNFRTNLLNEVSNLSSTMGIVSRYYVKDSYTSAGEEASLLYIHKGEPVILSSFNIRIKDSDRDLATDIGPDSTVFLQIVKADPELKKKNKN
tara:strand:- start:3867 stop:5813 length:1947 start_codon:yes stop_codon:yes gene_type:complete